MAVGAVVQHTVDGLVSKAVGAVVQHTVDSLTDRAVGAVVQHTVNTLVSGDILGYGPVNKPHLAGKGGIEYQVAGAPIGTRGAVDFLNASDIQDDAGNDRVDVSISPPTGPTGPQGGVGPAGPTGQGFSFASATVSTIVAAFPTRTGTASIPTGVTPVRFFQVTENVDNFQAANANDRLAITGVSCTAAGIIQVAFLTDDWDGINSSDMRLYGMAAR